MLRYLKLLILCLIVFTGCDYQPIFKNKKYNFSIEVIERTGEKIINNIISNRLVIFKDRSKIYDIKLNSKKNRQIISKDSKGDPSKLQISIECNFTILSDDKILTSMTIVKKMDYNNNSDKFELKNYENFLIQNLSNSIADEIINKISNFKN